MKTILIPVTLVLFVVADSYVGLAAEQPEQKVTIKPREAWSSVFGGSDISLHFDVVHKREAPVEGRVQWHHSANQRTIARGEVPVRADDEPSAEIMLQLPEVRDGIIFQTQLTVEYVPRGEGQAAASFTKQLWLFPQDPFVDRQKWLEELNLSLFDPEGQTAELFDQIGIPHRQIRNVAVLEDQEEHPFVIVGEGTSLIRNRRLAERLIGLAASGSTVVVFAPSEGAIPIPGQTSDDDAANVTTLPGELRFQKHHVIRELDKRLDAIAWSGLDALPATRISLQNRLGRIEADVTEDGNWPWLEIHYPEDGGVFLLCGFKLIEHWEHGPSPRFLFARILESQHQQRTPKNTLP